MSLTENHKLVFLHQQVDSQICRRLGTFRHAVQYVLKKDLRKVDK